MAPSKATVPIAVKTPFIQSDTWNSSSTGHQRGESKLGGSIGWRQSRNKKLSQQFGNRNTRETYMHDLNGAGSYDCDEEAQYKTHKKMMTRTEVSVIDMLRGGKSGIGAAGHQMSSDRSTFNEDTPRRNEKQENEPKARHPIRRGIFNGLVIHINGSTSPLISDHRLKHLLAEHGGEVSTHLSRKNVTHVIVGRSCCSAGSIGVSDYKVPGAGGGLAATKAQKEIRRVGGFGIRYVGVEWVLESLKAGKRIPETRFGHRITHSGQKSMYEVLERSKYDVR